MNPTANFASNLSSVPEESSLLLNDSNKPNEELEEPVIKVERLEVPKDEADVAGGSRRQSFNFRRHSNAAFRRKSSFSAQFSKLRKYSFSRQRSQDQSENNEVVLRKNV